jgi:hypothetical protein
MNTGVLRRIELWASACLVAGFFLPWFSQSTFIGMLSLSGYQTSDGMRQHAAEDIKRRRARIEAPISIFNRPLTDAEKRDAAKKIVDLQMTIVLSYALYLIPLVGLICFILTLTGTTGSMVRFIYVLSGSIIVWAVASLLLTQNEDGKLLQQASIGIWLTVLSGAALLVSIRLPAASTAKKDMVVEDAAMSSD